MAVLPISVHAARWDLEDAIAKGTATVALLDAYVAVLVDDVDDRIKNAGDERYRAGRAEGYEDGRIEGEAAVKADLDDARNQLSVLAADRDALQRAVAELRGGAA